MSSQISDKKLAANRANAKKSTGPKSSAGKARSSQNARTHGLCAGVFPILTRDRRRFRQLQQELRDYFRASGAIEEGLVDQIVLARWHLTQAERLLQGYWDLVECPDLPAPKGRVTERHRCRQLAQAFLKDAGANAFMKILRYKQSAHRDSLAIQKALFALREAVSPPESETKPPRESPSPITNPFYRQKLYAELRQLERDAKGLPPVFDDPALARNGSKR